MFKLEVPGWRLSFRDMGDISGKRLTPANIRTLTGGKTTRKYVFKTQTDGRFRAKLKLEKNQSGRWETVMLERKNY